MFSTLLAYLPAVLLPYLPGRHNQYHVHHGGAAVSELVLCSEIAADILRIGGSAADAMIAQVLCVGTAQGSYHSGIGGGGFAIVRSIGEDGQKEYETVDFGVQAPGLANETLFESRSSASLTGGLATAIPGQLLGLEYLHTKHGKIPWADLFQPSIKLAKEGFEINRDLYRAMQSVAPRSNETHDLHSNPPLPSFLQTDPLFRKIFSSPNGTLLPIGSHTTQPTYAQTLEKIARGGARVMYEGEMAKGLVQAVRDAGGIWTEGDLAGYAIRIGTPLSVKYRNHTVMSAGAPSGGASLLSALNTLSGYEMNGVGYPLDDHRMVEALKHTFSRRNLLGDPRYVPGTHALEKESLTYESGARDRARIIDDRTFDPDYYDPGTSQLVTADSNGLVISMTTTVTGYWGAQFMDPKSGVVFNNGMANFASNATSPFGYIAAPANFIKPHKRALSSMCPYLIEGGDDAESGSKGMIYAGGSAGGSRIISANAQVIRNLIDYRMSAEDSILEPRLHDQVVPIGTSLELSRPAEGDPAHDVRGFSDARAEALKEKGHEVGWIGVGQSIPAGLLYREGEGWEAAADGRRWDAGGVVLS